MRVSDEKLAEAWDRGFAVVEGFLDAETLGGRARRNVDRVPDAGSLLRRPADYPEFSASQFAGLRNFPYADWALNRLPVHPDLIDAAERFLGATHALRRVEALLPA